MYHAKKNGRNRHFWFDPMLEDELRLRNELETAIRRGIPAGEFVPYYEQQIDLESGTLTGPSGSAPAVARVSSPFSTTQPEPGASFL